MIQDGRTTWVYWLLDPRAPLFRFPHPTVFYVGISVHPNWRFHEHKTDWCSAARPRIEEIERDGEQCKMELLHEFENRQQAFDLEYELVCRLPNLVNRDQRKYVLWQGSAA
jgi:hypothetical protein